MGHYTLPRAIVTGKICQILLVSQIQQPIAEPMFPTMKKASCNRLSRTGGFSYDLDSDQRWLYSPPSERTVPPRAPVGSGIS